LMFPREKPFGVRMARAPRLGVAPIPIAGAFGPLGIGGAFTLGIGGAFTLGILGALAMPTSRCPSRPYSTHSSSSWRVRR
jgi:hypothetical protein